MSGFFYDLGRKAAPAVLRTRWIYRSLTGTESERIKSEYAMGCYLTYLHTRDGNLDRTPQTVRWLNETAGRLAHCLINRERRFQVRCLNSPEPNAFALPGGFLFVSRSLLDLCEFDEDEIAFVLAHEMGHVVRSHSFNRLLTSEVAKVLSRGGPVKGALKPIVGRLVNQLVTQGYSRRQEFEADHFAARLTRAAGYDPQASRRLFDRLKGLASEPENLAAYFSSHPPFADRIRRLQNPLD
jgi:beta-barrel assembly-enhancing protease